MTGSGQTILLIDSSIESQEDIKKSLVQAGFDVVLAHDDLHALNVLIGTQPVLVIFDLELPLLDGDRVRRAVLNSGRISKSALLVLYTDEKKLGLLNPRFFRPYEQLQRPVSSTVVLEIVRHILAESEAPPERS